MNVATDASTADMARMAAEGLIEKIDWAAINPKPMFDEAKNEWGFGSSYYSTIMAWKAGAKAPSNWVEFFDTQNFPGKRALPNYPDFVPPFAAMGGGQKPEDLANGVNMDLAFETLRKIKNDVIWWKWAPEPPQLLKDNEGAVRDLVVGPRGRTGGHRDLVQPGHARRLVVRDREGCVRRPEEDAVPVVLRADHSGKQACVAQYISYPGPSPELEAMLPKDKLNQFPTYSENKKVQWLTNGDWWYKNAAEIEKRWNEFKLEQ